jgi:hypothetical protein
MDVPEELPIPLAFGQTETPEGLATFFALNLSALARSEGANTH